MEKAVKYLLIALGAVAGGSATALAINKFSGSGAKLSSGGKILFIGDSYTAGSNSYADQLKKMIPSIDIKKIAKVGEKTDWMLSNSSNEISGNKYNAVFILGGLNDIYALGSIDSTKKNLQAIYDMAKKSGAKVIGITVAPTDYYSAYTPAKGKLTDDLNAWIKHNKTADISIDFNKMLKSGSRQDTGLFVADKLHASTKGHEMLATDIKRKIFLK
jgi:hypothetical protein